MMDKQMYERIKAGIETAYKRHMANLEELANFAGYKPEPEYKNFVESKVVTSKPKQPVAPQMKTLKQIPAVPVHANGSTESAEIKPRKEAIRVPCQMPKCDKQMQRPKKCPQCTKEVCSLHWTRKGICTDCALRPQ